nr:hypothetical protein HmN_000924400 [Hymenolepis microstoma]
MFYIDQVEVDLQRGPNCVVRSNTLDVEAVALPLQPVDAALQRAELLLVLANERLERLASCCQLSPVRREGELRLQPPFSDRVAILQEDVEIPVFNLLLLLNFDLEALRFLRIVSVHSVQAINNLQNSTP